MSYGISRLCLTLLLRIRKVLSSNRCGPEPGRTSWSTRFIISRSLYRKMLRWPFSSTSFQIHLAVKNYYTNRWYATIVDDKLSLNKPKIKATKCRTVHRSHGKQIEAARKHIAATEQQLLSNFPCKILRNALPPFRLRQHQKNEIASLVLFRNNQIPY